MQIVQNLLYQMRELFLSLGTLGIGITVFLALLLLVVGVSAVTNGLKCDTYATEQLAEWFSFVDSWCTRG